MSATHPISRPQLAQEPAKSPAPLYSVVIPVFNSARIVGTTIDTLVRFFVDQGLRYEIILVNDASEDDSWMVLSEKAAANPNILAINLLKNYGQHVANLCGLRQATGDYVVTMDDDLQNPPAEILHLIAKAQQGHDVVFGQFRVKQHGLSRRLGSKLIGSINRLVFHQPDHLTVSNFRILRRDVVDRICRYRVHYPYLSGLAVMFSRSPANVAVEHRARQSGSSNYNLRRIFNLVATILLSYSSIPLHATAFLGFVVAVGSFIVGIATLINFFTRGVDVPGWTTLVVLLAFLNGVVILMLSMLGEYVIRLIAHVRADSPYVIAERVGGRD